MEKQDNRKRFLASALFVIIFLLGINAYFLYNSFNMERQLDAKEMEMEERERVRAELEKQYYEALSDLEEMRGNNDQLNDIIEAQKQDLKLRKEEISRLINEKHDLAKAKEKLVELQEQLEVFLQENQRLRSRNKELETLNQNLSAENQQLNSNLDSQQLAFNSLAEKQAFLSEEKKELESSNYQLNKKVNFASVVRVKDIDVEGFKIRGSGRTVKKRSAKSVEQLNVCFTTTKNELAPSGTEEFFIRILNPIGETMAIEELGSGVMETSESPEPLRYTSVKAYDYANDENRVCFTWKPDISFSSGDYTVEVYNKGYLAGTSTFNLK